MLTAKPERATCFYSRLIPELFDLRRLESGGSIRVLDFGPAHGDTIKFLSQFNCRLHIIDLIGEIRKINHYVALNDEIGDSEIVVAIEKALNLDKTQVFDVCLFWDIFNYQSPRVMSLFTQALLPHLAPGFIGHGFAVLNKSTILTEQNYGIINGELLSVCDQSKNELPYRHTQASFRDAARSIAIHQSILREDGRLEMILKRV